MNAQARFADRSHPLQRCWFRHRFRWLSGTRRSRLCQVRWHRARIVAILLSVITFGAGPVFDGVSPADAAVAGWCATSLRPADVWNTFTVDVNVKRNEIPKDYLSRMKMAYLEDGASPSRTWYGWVAG